MTETTEHETLTTDQLCEVFVEMPYVMERLGEAISHISRARRSWDDNGLPNLAVRSAFLSEGLLDELSAKLQKLARQVEDWAIYAEKELVWRAKP